MSTLLQALYTALLWATRIELAVAMNAPERNRQHITGLQQDISEYERALIQLQLNV